MKTESCKCAIVGPKKLQLLMQKYLGIEPEAALAVGDARVAEAKAKLDAIIAAESSAPNRAEQK